MEPSAVKAVGVWFRSRDTDRYLYLMRNDTRHPNTWALPGGKINPGETLLDGMQRECREELGSFPEYQQLIPLETFTSVDGDFEYHTWLCLIEREFHPRLNHEHLGYAWINHDVWPRPMHPGLWNTVNIQVIQDKLKSLEL